MKVVRMYTLKQIGTVLARLKSKGYYLGKGSKLNKLTIGELDVLSRKKVLQ